MIHELKCAKEYFEAVVSGKKTFEVRKNDRQYEEGDFLAMNEVQYVSEIRKDGDGTITEQVLNYTGRSCLVQVVYILNDDRYLKPGYVCMSIRPCAIGSATERMRFEYNRDLYEVPTYNN